MDQNGSTDTPMDDRLGPFEFYIGCGIALLQMAFPMLGINVNILLGFGLIALAIGLFMDSWRRLCKARKWSTRRFGIGASVLIAIACGILFVAFKNAYAPKATAISVLNESQEAQPAGYSGGKASVISYSYNITINHFHGNQPAVNKPGFETFQQFTNLIWVVIDLPRHSPAALELSTNAIALFESGNDPEFSKWIDARPRIKSIAYYIAAGRLDDTDTNQQLAYDYTIKAKSLFFNDINESLLFCTAHNLAGRFGAQRNFTRGLELSLQSIEAYNNYKDVIERDVAPKTIESVFFRAARLSYDLGQFQQALSFITRGMSIHPTKRSVLLKYHTLRKMGNAEEAKRWAVKWFDIQASNRQTVKRVPVFRKDVIAHDP